MHMHEESWKGVTVNQWKACERMMKSKYKKNKIVALLLRVILKFLTSFSIILCKLYHIISFLSH